MSQLRVRVVLAVTCLLAALALAACGQGGSGTPGYGGSPARPTPSTTAAPGTVVEVKATDFALALDRTKFAPGRYTFVEKDEGQVPHSLSISGPGLQQTATAAVISPGEETRLTVDLQAGTYDLWCPVDGHRARGMETHIQVMP